MYNSNDQRLAQVVDFLKSQWMMNDTGVVAAGIWDGLNPPLFATATKHSSKNWLHAEFNVVAKYIHYHGGFLMPKEEIQIVTTLSPCTRRTMESRSSCSSILKNLGLVNIYSGVLDTSLGIEDNSIYRDIGINVEVTSDNYFKYVCKKLMRVFQEKRDLSLLEIKEGFVW